MPSLRARALNGALRLLVKRRLARAPFTHAAILAERAGLERVAARRKVPAGFDIDASGHLGGRQAERITPPLHDLDRTVLYLHGGAAMVGSPKTYRALTWRLAEATRAAVVTPDYRLAPEHPWPAAPDDCLAAYRDLLAQGTAPGDILLAGDSAGGNLVLVTLLRIRDQGLPMPAGAVAISPWADLTGSSPSHRDNARRDPMLPAQAMPDAARAYLTGEVDGWAQAPADHGAGLDHPHVSPVFGDFRGLCPLLLHAGSTEILRDDAIRVRDAAERAGVAVEYRQWHALSHVFHIMADLIPDAQVAIDEIGAWARRTWQEQAESAAPAPICQVA